MFLFGLQHWISPHSQLVAELVLVKIRTRVVFSGAPETLANHSLSTGSISTQVFYICCLHCFYRTPCNRCVVIFSVKGPNNFPCFQEGHIPLVFNLNCFFFFFVNNARSCVIGMILSAVCTSNFFQAIFLHVVRVHFIGFRTCLLSSTGFHVVSIFLAFETPQGSWNILLISLKTKVDLHLFGSTGLIKCQDVSVGLDSFFAFSDGDSSYICNSLFSQGWYYLLFCS